VASRRAAAARVHQRFAFGFSSSGINRVTMVLSSVRVRSWTCHRPSV
jgi:hypothetical protein